MFNKYSWYLFVDLHLEVKRWGQQIGERDKITQMVPEGSDGFSNNNISLKVIH